MLLLFRNFKNSLKQKEDTEKQLIQRQHDEKMSKWKSELEKITKESESKLQTTSIEHQKQLDDLKAKHAQEIGNLKADFSNQLSSLKSSLEKQNDLEIAQFRNKLQEKTDKIKSDMAEFDSQHLKEMEKLSNKKDVEKDQIIREVDELKEHVNFN